MMKNFFYFFAFISMIFVSCSTSDDTTSQDVLVTKMIQSFEDGTFETINFNYSGNKLLGQTFDNGYSTVTYTGDLISKIEVFFNNALESRTLYTYDSNQRLTQFERYEYDDFSDYGDKIVYTYNTNGTVSFSEYSGNLDNPLTLSNTGTYTLNAIGEVVSVSTLNSGNTTYTYDDKNSPYLNVLGLNKLLFDEDPNGMIHNIVQELNSFNYNRTSTFSYNAAGFPVTEQIEEDDEIINIQYFYNTDN